MYYHQDDINGTTSPPVGDPTDFNIPSLANPSPTSSVFPPLSMTKSSPFSSPSPSVFSVGLKRPVPQVNQWGNAATPHSLLPNGWPTAMAHVPHGQMVPNMMKQIIPPANPVLSLPYPPIVHSSDLSDYDGSGFSAQYSDQSSQFFEPSFEASFVNASSSRSPSISMAFMGLRTPASQAIAYPPRRLFSPQFSISNNGEPRAQHYYDPSSPSMFPSNLRKYTNPSIQPVQSSSHPHVIFSNDTQTHVLRAVCHPRGSASSTSYTFSPSSSMGSGRDAQFSPPTLINKLRQKEFIYHHHHPVASQETIIPRIPSHSGGSYGTDRSTLLQGEIERDQHLEFNQVHKTDNDTSSKVRTQCSGRSPPVRHEVWFRRGSKCNGDGRSRKGSGERPDSEKRLPTASPSSAPSLEQKKKRKIDGESHPGSSTSCSSMQAPPAKRRRRAILPVPSLETPTVSAKTLPSSTTEQAIASTSSGQVVFDFKASPFTALALASASTSPSFPFPPPPSKKEIVMHEETISDNIMEVRAATFGPPKVKDPWVETRIVDVDGGLRGLM